MTRGEFLRMTAAASAWWSMRRAAPRAPAAQDGNDLVDRVSRVIDTFDRQGIHRTATAVDRQCATWLLEQVRRAGAADAALEPFALSRVDPGECSVASGQVKIEGLPLFDGTFTSQRGITGRLGPPGSGSDIVLTHVDQAGISSEGRVLAELRRGSHRAVIVITRGAHEGLTPMNAGSFAAPFGVPVLQVASEHASWLEDLARAGATVRFLAQATRRQAEAQNVVASVKGRSTGLPPIVVMTPRSGWWHSTAERGGGLACWLEAARAAAAARPARSVIFVASSGHELGHLGLASFIERRRELVKGATAWVHLGANIGAAAGRARLQASDDELEQSAVAALSRAGTSVQQRLALGTVPAGEARNIHIGGGRYVSLLGSSPVFHSQSDRWPDAVDVAAVARFAAAMADLVVSLASRN